MRKPWQNRVKALREKQNLVNKIPNFVFWEKHFSRFLYSLRRKQILTYELDLTFFQANLE